MGGHVAVRSAVGAGSTFTFALPRFARESQRAGREGALPPGMGEDDPRPARAVHGVNWFVVRTQLANRP